MATDPTYHDVVVIGAGISGLTAAWQLYKHGIDVRLIEGSNEVGGVMRTESRDGFLLEKGPFNVIVREPAFQDLLEELRDELLVVEADRSAARARYVLHDDRLWKVPSNPIALASTGLLTFAGKARLIRGLLYSHTSTDRDGSIDEAASRRFGPEIAQRLVSALCVGIFAGESCDLSLEACLPRVAEIDRQTRSLLGFALAQRLRRKRQSHAPRRWRGLVSFREGLGQLPTTLAHQLGDRLLMNCQASSIRKVDRQYVIRCSSASNTTRTFRASHIILAVPQRVTAALLDQIAPRIAEDLNAIATASLVVLNLGFDRAHVGHPLQGYGFLVPTPSSSFPLLGVLWADSVFPHHAPPNRRLLRVFMGGSRRPDMLNKSDTELVEIAIRALRDHLQLTGDPTLIDVCRWPDAIPQYSAGHVQRAAEIHREVERHYGLHLAGNYLDGISINDCIGNASRVAEEVTQHVRQMKDSHRIERKSTTAEEATAIAGSVESA